MNRTASSRVVVALLALFVPGGSPVGAAPAAPGPVVLRQSLFLRAASMHDDDWVPSIAFLLQGALPSGASLFAEFKKPDGSPWGKVNLSVDRADDRGVAFVRETMLDPQSAIRNVGTVQFTVQLSSELENLHRTLFAGRFRVEKLAPADSYHKPAFAVDHDWVLPLAQVYLDATSPDNPALFVTIWFKRHDVGCNDVDAYLYVGGKQVANTESSDAGDKSMSETLRATDDRDDRRYVQCRFEFHTVKGYVNGTYQDQASWHELTKNPGDYEVKILRQKKLDRTLKFSVDKNGLLVRGGAIEPGYRGLRMLLPVNVVGSGDGEWKKATVAADAFYGNPLDAGKSAEVPIIEMYGAWSRRPKSRAGSSAPSSSPKLK